VTVLDGVRTRAPGAIEHEGAAHWVSAQAPTRSVPDWSYGPCGFASVGRCANGVMIVANAGAALEVAAVEVVAAVVPYETRSE
jgi:hypothetical protein